MSKQNEPEEVGLDRVLSWIDRLSVEELHGLERAIQKKVWRQRLKKLGAVPENAAATWQKFIERVESGNIDEDIRTTVDRTLALFLEQCLSSSESSDTGARSAGTSWRDIVSGFRSDDPTREFEQLYQDLQTNLIQIRGAVAQTIAAEKQLEQQLKKNQEQANSWQNRADMAVSQGNDDLSRQALARKKQYEDAAAALEIELREQRESTVTFRQRLTDIEGAVQKAYAKKSALLARYRAAEATKRANQILSKSSVDSACTVIERMEKAVAEREAQAGAPLAAREEIVSKLVTEQLLKETVQALVRCTAVIESMEKRVAECEAQVVAGHGAHGTHGTASQSMDS